MQRKSRKISS